MTHILNLQTITVAPVDDLGYEHLGLDECSTGSSPSLWTCPNSVTSLITCFDIG